MIWFINIFLIQLHILEVAQNQNADEQQQHDEDDSRDQVAAWSETRTSKVISSYYSHFGS